MLSNGCWATIINKYTQSRPTQLPTLSGMGNEYRPKGCEALRLWSKGRYGSFHLWINVRVAGKTVSSTRAIPERLRDELADTYCPYRTLLLVHTACVLVYSAPCRRIFCHHVVVAICAAIRRWWVDVFMELILINAAQEKVGAPSL